MQKAKIENITWELDDHDNAYIQSIQNLLVQSKDCFNQYNIRGSIDKIPKLWDICNKLVTETEPWKLKNEHIKRNKVIYLVCETIRNISILLYPCLTTLMRDLNNYLSIEEKDILVENLGFRKIDKSTPFSSNFNYNKSENHEFLKINLDAREKVFQNKFEL